MSFLRGCLRLLVLFYGVCFCLVRISNSDCSRWNTSAFAVSRGIRTYSGPRALLGVNLDCRVASLTELSFLRRGNERLQARRREPCCSQGWRTEGASLLHCAGSCAAAAAQTLQQTGLSASAVRTAAGPGAADPSAALASPVTSFSAGIEDTSLPPQSTDPPLVDRGLCRSDLIRGGAGAPHEEAGRQWQPLGGDGLLRTVPSEGPVSYFDARENVHPSLIGASDDAFFFDFYGPLQLGVVEVAQSALSAAKRFLRTAKLKDRSLLGCKGSSAHPPYVNKLQKGIPRCSPVQRQDAANAVVGSVDLSALLEEKRFSRPPYWLSERVAYILRYLRPPTFGFLVAQMLQAICRVAAAEAKLGVRLDEYAARRMQTYVRRARQRSPEEHLMQLTKGTSWEFKDALKFLRGFPLFPWGLPVDPQATRSFMQQQLRVTEKALTQYFFAARRAAGQGGARAARYRVPEDQAPAEGPVRRVYEGFNSAAVECIKHITSAWHRPVYILSSLERARSVRQLLEALGLSKEALQRVHICGADGILFGTDPDGSKPREVRTGVPAQMQFEGLTPEGQLAGRSTATPSAMEGDEADAEGPAAAAASNPPVAPAGSAVAAKLDGALALWEYHKTLGLRGVPHFFDDDVRTLEAAAADPRMRQWRLYFCDWGFSSYEEKLQAVISDRMKVIPTMSRMADILLTPGYLATRFWALGSTAAPMEWLEEGRMRRWLRLSGAM